MAVYLYTGPPGSGKSYALVSQVIVPGVLKGRRVVTNVDGVNPEAIMGYCAWHHPDKQLGEVVLFHGDDATKDGTFWPHEGQPDTDTFIKAGDLVVFDEWRLYFPRRGKQPTDDMEAFLRYHRHLVNERGVTCDISIGTQLATDLSNDFRGVVERSFKFRKLKSIGLSKAYSWKAFEGHLQNKDTANAWQTRMYDPEIFPLYKTSTGPTEQHVEEETDSRTSAIPKWLPYVGVVLLIAMGFAVSFLLDFFSGEAMGIESADGGGVAVQSGVASAQPVAAAPAASPWRITGHYVGEYGLKVVLMNDKGGVRYVDASDFRFEGDRPVSGVVDGVPVRVEDRVAPSEDLLAEKVMP